MGCNWDPGCDERLTDEAELRVCSAVWEIVQDYRERFDGNSILEDLARDLEEALAYGPEDV